MQNLSNITILPALGDNYIYIVEYGPACCFVIDPGDAEIVLEELVRRHLQLNYILVTHHHADHIGGLNKLKAETGCCVIGSDANRIKNIDRVVTDGDTIEFADTTILCIATPGHTATSVCFFISGKSLTQPVLFTGDTLFVCGCGRMFECDGQTMYTSLQKLIRLDDETLIYPGHNYTEENLEFALSFRPGNPALLQKLSEVSEKLACSKPTVPSTLAEEKKLNPFLIAPDWKTFTQLRKQKDIF